MMERTSVLLASTVENSRSFQIHVNCSRKVAVIGPQQLGKMMREKTTHSLAPSMRAASSISCDSPVMKLRSTSTGKGMQMAV